VLSWFKKSAQANDEEAREIGRGRRAAVVAGLVAVGLGFGACLAAGKGSLNAVWAALCAAPFTAIFGVIAGAAGASKKTLDRAGLFGAAALGALSVIPAAADNSPLPLDRVWFVAFACAVGSICAQAAWMVGGLAPSDPSRPKPGQFTLRQLLAFFIPVAIYLGYIRYLLDR
jgi:hypothetical protein